MRLALCKRYVKGLRFGDRTCVADGVLQIDKAKAIASVADDSRIESFDIELASPGESVRIIPVKDVVEPRVKLSGDERCGYFPGFCMPMEKAGEGKTFVLSGAAVVTCGPIVAFQEGFIDMAGPGADYTPFSVTHNVVLVAKPAPGVTEHKYEAALREAGLKLSVYLAQACAADGYDDTEVFEKASSFDESKAHAGLPRVMYYCMSITQGLLHDTYVYGADLKPSFPVMLHPNEILDGALVSGNCVSSCDKNTTYHHANNPVVRALYARHGVDLNFVGVVPTIESTVLEGKARAAQRNLALAQEFGIDGVVFTEEGYGNPDSDLCINAKMFEAAGIPAVMVSDEAAGTDGASQSLADSTPELISFVSTGNVNEMIEVPKLDRVIGDVASIANLSGGAEESLRADGSMYVELQSIIGSTSELGFSRVGCDWI